MKNSNRTEPAALETVRVRRVEGSDIIVTSVNMNFENFVTKLSVGLAGFCFSDMVSIKERQEFLTFLNTFFQKT